MAKKKKEGLVDRLPLLPMRKTPVLDRLRKKDENEGEERPEGEKTLEERSAILLKRTTYPKTIPSPRGQRPRGKTIKGPYYNVRVPAEGLAPTVGDTVVDSEGYESRIMSITPGKDVILRSDRGEKQVSMETILKYYTIKGQLEKKNAPKSTFRTGDIVRVRGEGDILHKVLEAEDERGPMARVLIEAQLPGWTILPTTRVNREDILPLRLAILTSEEDAYWNYAFPHYVEEGMTDDQAGQQTWKEMQEKFPRLKAYDGATAETPKPKKRGRPRGKAGPGPLPPHDDDQDILIDRARDGKADAEHGELDYGSAYLFLNTGLKNTPYAILQMDPGRHEWSMTKYKSREDTLKAWETEYKRFMKFKGTENSNENQITWRYNKFGHVEVWKGALNFYELEGKESDLYLQAEADVEAFFKEIGMDPDQVNPMDWDKAKDPGYF